MLANPPLPLAAMAPGDESPDAAAARPARMPQLDALRAFAVMAVVVHHGEFALGAMTGQLALLGVQLFFALSGFLITSILLRSRRQVEARERTTMAVAREFYLRRTLRIFPLYYLVIAIGLVVDLSPAREAWPWLASYTYNIYVAKLGWFTEHYAHLWSLAIEEQFYLVWPWLMLLVPRRWLRAAIVATIAAGPLFRYYVLTHAESEVETYVLTPLYLDMLGMGALLALLAQAPLAPAYFRRLLNAGFLPAGLLGTALFRLAPPAWLAESVRFALADLFLALLFCWLVGSASVGFGGLPRRILELRPLRYVGEISYGIYVYHLFMRPFCRWVFRLAGLPYPQARAVDFAIWSTATLIVAVLSWHWFEKPIRDLGYRWTGDSPPSRFTATIAGAAEVAP